MTFDNLVGAITLGDVDGDDVDDLLVSDTVSSRVPLRYN